MTVCSIEFLVGVLVVAALFPLLPNAWTRRALLAACNALFLITLIPNLWSWLAVIIFLFSGFGMAVVAKRKPSGIWLGVYWAVLVAVFVYLQNYVFLELFPRAWLLQHPVTIVGLSYMLFRQIHFIVDAMQGQIERVTLWAYLNYQFNVFGLLAGPIQRYQDFYEYWREPKMALLDRHTLLKTYLRILLGVIKLAGASTLCLFAYQKFSDQVVQVHLGNQVPGRAQAIVQFVVVFYSYPAYVFLNFSGYCDIVIGSAALVGLKMPENFDRPYLARNMIDYWNRWHKTLSFWIRDYIFTPLYKAIAERCPHRAPSLAFLCYFVALFLAGVWHGSTWNWMVFGVLNGIGVSAAKLWENHLIKRRGRSGLRNYLQSVPIRRLAVVCNIHFACLTMLFFPTGLDRSLNILKGFWRGVHG